MCKIGHIQCDGCDERIVPLYFLSSTQWMDMMSYYDDEDNIGRDVEEEERKRVVINNAAEENEDDTNQTKLLLCGIFFALSHQFRLKFAQHIFFI